MENKKRRSFKSLFTKKKRLALQEKYKELNDQYENLNTLYADSMTLRNLLAEGEAKNLAIDIEETIFSEIKVLVYKMSVINKQLERLG